MAVVVARRPPTMTPTTTIASVRRGGMEAAAVAGENVTTTTRTIIEIPMIGIIGMATDTEIAEAEVEGGPAEVGAEVILVADRIRIGAGRLGMSVGSATATTAGGNDQDPDPGRHTTEGGRIGTEMVADRPAMATRIGEAGEDGVVVRLTDGKIGIKNDTAVGNKERRKAMRPVGGIVVIMIRQEGIVIVTVTVTDTARRLSVMAMVKKGIVMANVGGVDREAGLGKEGREIEWRKAKRRKNVEYNNKYSSAWE